MKPRLVVILIVIVAIYLFVTLSSSLRTPLTLEDEESELAQISLPLKGITGDMILDGGSVYLEIIDSRNQIHKFAFPIKGGVGGVGGSYPTVLSGTAHASIAPGVPMVDSARAKVVLLSLLEKYHKPLDKGALRVKYALLGRPAKLHEEIPARVFYGLTNY